MDQIVCGIRRHCDAGFFRTSSAEMEQKNMEQYATQMEAARKGIVTEELKKVAAKERMTTEELMPLVAEGKVVICANRHHRCIDPEGVGSMLRTKINVNLGISRDCKDYDVEMEKVMAAVFMLTMVLPQFASMLQEQELPWITRMMMRLSFSLRSHGFLYIMLILILMALFKGILKCPSVRLQADRAVLYTPIIGKLLRTVYTSRFASAFAVLYGSGIGILDAMHTVGRVMGNSYVEKGLAQAAERLKGGVMLSQALEEQDLFQPVLISMVAAGEESGALDMVLEDAGSFYEKEAARAVNQMIALLEPAMILILALVVGSVVMAIMMPVFNMYSSML